MVEPEEKKSSLCILPLLKVKANTGDETHYTMQLLKAAIKTFVTGA